MRKNKLILIGTMIFVVVLATGCGKKETKLSCTQTASGVDITLNLNFKGNEINDMDVKYEMDLSEYPDEVIDLMKEQDFCEVVKNGMDELNNAFTNCKQDVSNKKLNVYSTLDVNKVDNDLLEKMPSPEEAKEELEAEGYTCTIK